MAAGPDVAVEQAVEQLKRRGFARLVAGACVWPVAVHGQSNLEVPKVGFLYTGPRQLAAPRVDAIMNGIRASGHALPQVEMVLRVTDGDPASIDPMVGEIIGRNVAVFLMTGPAALKSARAATKTLPLIAIDFETDPMVAGYVQSIGRPGGNVSGVFLDFPNFAGKWIELLVELVPKVARIAVMWDPATGPVQVDTLKKTAAALNILLDVFDTKVRGDFSAAFAAAQERGAGAAIMTSSPLVPASVKDLAELALRHKLPAITMFSEFPRTGGLVSYGPNLLGGVRQIGVLAGKVLSGTAPANLPIERPSKFELIVNTRAAEALGLAIPASIQVRADEVIE